MDKVVTCPTCGEQSVQQSADVTPQQAEQLEAVGDDRMRIFRCPKCQGKIVVKMWDLPGLPDPP
jgi:DNA-directed RNA polymerase subunit RPC12/RpoP